MVTGGAFFLLLVIVNSRIKFKRSEAMGIWKSSPLALLLYGLELDILKDFGSVESVRQMKQATNKLQVKLLMDDSNHSHLSKSEKQE